MMEHNLRIIGKDGMAALIPAAAIGLGLVYLLPRILECAQDTLCHMMTEGYALNIQLGSFHFAFGRDACAN